MLQVPVAELDVMPGHVVEWKVRYAKPQEPDGTAPPRGSTSFNQEKHFTVARRARSAGDPLSSYVAGTFELRGPLDRPALEAALLGFVRRHEVLRCEFQQLAGDVTCEPLPPEEVELELVDVGAADTADEVRAHLDRSFQQVDTLAWPLFVLGAVVRPASTTVFVAFDHLVSDGVSTPVAVDDIASAYAALRRGEDPGDGEAGSFLDFSREQRERYRNLTADDPRFGHWKDFMARNGGFFPPFPLDLGVEPGRMYPTVNETDGLLDAGDAAALEERCRAAGGRTVMGVLAAVATALREEGGPDVYRGILPVSERGPDRYARAMGWFVNTVPVEFPVPEGLGLADTLAGVRTGLERMRRAADIPFVQAWHLLAPEYADLRSWPYAVNFFSYLDFRRTPGGDRHTERRARKHIWASHSNGICFWFHRNDAGLHVNTIHADTPQARRTKAGLDRALRRTLHNLVRTGAF